MLDRITSWRPRRRQPGTPAAAPQRAAARPRSRLLRNALIAVAAFLALFAIAGFFIVPPVAKHYLVKSLTEQLGRKVAVADIDVNPFAMSASVKGFSIQEPAGAPVFVSFEELFVNLEYRSILRRAPVVREIRLTNPYVHVVRNADGKTYNFSDLVEKFSKPDAARPKDDDPARFSLNNIQLVNGRVEFDDRPKSARHTVREINVAIPFISNLPDTVEQYVQPAFSARVNDTPVAIKGQTKPFKDTLETSVDLDIRHLDLTRYVEYVPIKLNFRLASGFLDARITASFVRQINRSPMLLLRGSAGLEKLSLVQLDGKPLLNLAALTVPVPAIDVLARKFELGAIAVTSPEVFVRRAPDGTLNWLEALPRNEGKPDAPAEKTSAPAMSLGVTEIAIHDGQVHIEDAVPAKRFSTDLTGIQAALRGFSLPQKAPAQAELALRTSHGEAVNVASTIGIEPVAAAGTLSVEKVQLKTYEPYYADLLLYRLEDGVVDLKTGFAYRQAESGPQTRLEGLDVSLTSVRMRKPGAKEDFLRVKSARLSEATVDVGKLSLEAGQLATRDGFLNLVREADGALNATRILPAPKEARAKAGDSSPWQLSLGRVAVDKWKVAFTDEAVKEPVRIVADDLRVSATGLSNQKNRKGQVSLQTRLNEAGRLKVSGPLALNPVGAELAVELSGFGLVPLQPYFTDKVNVLLTSADLSVKGTARLASAADGALAAGYRGDFTLSDFASMDKATSEDLLKWRSLHFGGIDFTQSPLALSIEEVALADFFARIIIYPDGRLNLQDIAVRDQPAGTQEGTQEPASTKPPAAVATNGRGGSAAGAPAQSPATATTGTPPRGATAESGGPMPPVRIARVTLQGGDVNFTDLFIKPNYSADLSEIGGSVIGLSSQLDTTADVDLRGRFAKTAPVEIKGRINPLVKNLFLDLKASVRDIELGPFTPYSGKYVGYAIEKGKMSFAVDYKVENRKLAAQNKLVLNQLTFGEKIESPQATKLPVLLAISLLQDRNGVIDVNLPISGSLDDPQFSVGGIIWQVILNLLEKAVTAPFALIGNLLGGGGSGEELSYLEFDPGRAVLTQESRDKLTRLQSALIERPGLKLDVSGRYDPQTDRDGLRQYRFEQQIKAQKLKDLVKKGSPVKSVDEVQIDPAEYEKYLERAYKAAKFPKPKNIIGFTKDLPREEMEKLMLTNTQVTDDDLLQLANQRAQIAKDFLTRDDKVPLERVFLLAPKEAPAKGDAKGKARQVEFALK